MRLSLKFKKKKILGEKESENGPGFHRPKKKNQHLTFTPPVEKKKRAKGCVKKRTKDARRGGWGQLGSWRAREGKTSLG